MENAITTPSRISGRGETSLLVDDETFVREITCQALESAGYRVLPAENADEALWTFCQHEGPVHLLLADVVMQGRPCAGGGTGSVSPGDEDYSYLRLR